MLAEPTTVRGRSAALVVARSFVARDETLDHLLGELLLAGPPRCCSPLFAGYGPRPQPFDRSRRCARARRGDLGLDPRGAAPRARRPRRDLALSRRR